MGLHDFSLIIDVNFSHEYIVWPEFSQNSRIGIGELTIYGSDERINFIL